MSRLELNNDLFDQLVESQNSEVLIPLGRQVFELARSEILGFLESYFSLNERAQVAGKFREKVRELFSESETQIQIRSNRESGPNPDHVNIGAINSLVNEISNKGSDIRIILQAFELFKTKLEAKKKSSARVSKKENVVQEQEEINREKKADKNLDTKDTGSLEAKKENLKQEQDKNLELKKTIEKYTKQIIEEGIDGFISGNRKLIQNTGVNTNNIQRSLRRILNVEVVREIIEVETPEVPDRNEFEAEKAKEAFLFRLKLVLTLMITILIAIAIGTSVIVNNPNSENNEEIKTAQTEKGSKEKGKKLYGRSSSGFYYSRNLRVINTARTPFDELLGVIDSDIRRPVADREILKEQVRQLLKVPKPRISIEPNQNDNPEIPQAPNPFSRSRQISNPYQGYPNPIYPSGNNFDSPNTVSDLINPAANLNIPGVGGVDSQSRNNSQSSQAQYTKSQTHKPQYKKRIYERSMHITQPYSPHYPDYYKGLVLVYTDENGRKIDNFIPYNQSVRRSSKTSTITIIGSRTMDEVLSNTRLEYVFGFNGTTSTVPVSSIDNQTRID